MTTTTMKVDRVVRDRLACIARARGLTMTALLETVSLTLQAEQQWTEIETAYERLRQDNPQEWAEYIAELAEWEALATDDLGDAAKEWPEYNES